MTRKYPKIIKKVIKHKDYYRRSRYDILQGRAGRLVKGRSETLTAISQLPIKPGNTRHQKRSPNQMKAWYQVTAFRPRAVLEAMAAGLPIVATRIRAIGNA